MNKARYKFVGLNLDFSVEKARKVLGYAPAYTTEQGLAAAVADLVAAPEFKGGEEGVASAAAALGVPLIFVGKAELEAAGSRTQTSSKRVLSLTGVPSVAEAAALAVGGPAARLLVPRTIVGIATCALAVSEERA